MVSSRNKNLIRVGVLRGGPSDEYDLSLKSGATALKHLSHDKYHVTDVFIDRKGVWHVNGLAVKPADILSRLDVVVNALHGQYGEDGKVQQILDQHGIPYTGSGMLASAIAMNKALTKQALAKSGIKMPRHISLNKSEIEVQKLGKKIDHKIDSKINEIFRSFSLPVVVKPASNGSSIGLHIAKSFAELEQAIVAAFQYGETILVEEFIKGIEATVGVISDFRGSKLYSLPVVEVRTGKGKSHAEHIVPANFEEKHKKELERIAQEVHSKLGLEGYSRSDFIISPKGVVYFIETNTAPDLAEHSILPKALGSVGVAIGEYLEHLIHLAINRK
jgi:D-alanine-D-alanine ligase